MNMITIALILLVLVGYARILSLSLPYQPVVLTEENKNKILLLHNQARAKVNVPPLSWDEAMQIKAEQWSKNCNFNHEPASITNDNLAASDKPVLTNNTKIIELVVNAWLDEEKYHVTEGNWNCMSRDWQNKTCSHYTQDLLRKGCQQLWTVFIDVQSSDSILFEAF